MLRRLLKMVVRIILVLLILVPTALTLPRLVTGLYARSLTYTVEAAPKRAAVIVFGAGLWRDGSPTPVLRDRVATAARLYFAGKAEKLVMSGGNPTVYYDEPGAMRTYALSLGVPDEAIVLDYAGRRTYDTCYRARHIFGIREATLVTQGFHLPRALYLCNHLGIDGVGVQADLRQYRRSSRTFWNMREIPATLGALWDVHVARPLPILGDPEPIFPPEAQ
jgi:SanA protein